MINCLGENKRMIPVTILRGKNGNTLYYNRKKLESSLKTNKYREKKHKHKKFKS